MKNIPRITVQDFRPDEIVMAYWDQRIVIEEDADVFPVEIIIQRSSLT